jgi:hypothetical protein
LCRGFLWRSDIDIPRLMWRHGKLLALFTVVCLMSVYIWRGEYFGTNRLYMSVRSHWCCNDITRSSYRYPHGGDQDLIFLLQS